MEEEERRREKGHLSLEVRCEGYQTLLSKNSV